METVTSLDALSPGEIGTKAYRCCEMLLRGWNVPRTLVLPSSVCQAHLTDLGLPDDAPPELVRHALAGCCLLDAVRRGTNTFLRYLGTSVVVRSSALSEDAGLRSSAGIYFTALDCPDTTAVERAIIDCWVSLWSPEAVRYRRDVSLSHPPAGMAVLIMENIDAVASGVVFTCSPLTGTPGFHIEVGSPSPNRIVLPAEFETIRPESIPAAGIESAQIIALCRHARRLAELYGRPQDIEWCGDRAGTLWFLQCRDAYLTPPLPAFAPPGPGAWRIIDHIARPGTRCFAEYYYEPMERAWNAEARRIGSTLRVRIRPINRFMYYQPYLEPAGAPSRDFWDPECLSATAQGWVHAWRPGAIRRLQALQDIQPAALSDADLVRHLSRAFCLTRQMVRLHHRFTLTCLAVVGDFVLQAGAWSGEPEMDVLAALQMEASPGLLRGAKDVAGPAEEMEFRVGWRIISGYDITSETYVERPELLRNIVQSLQERGTSFQSRSAAIHRIRDRVPEKMRPAFDIARAQAAEFQKLRHERGFFSDLWAIGILRHAYLEAGRRLARCGVLDAPELALEAGIVELRALLQGHAAVSSAQLATRVRFRKNYTVADAPAMLGEPDPPDALAPPPNRLTRALLCGFRLAVDGPAESYPQGGHRGVPASRGCAEGPATVVTDASRLYDVHPGDILVVPQATAALAPMLSVVAGVIAEFGGALSHAAILAREYGVPCVVGFPGATRTISTGMRVRIDGGLGTVQMAGDVSILVRRLEELRCTYTGPMRVRNRDRIRNHSLAVANRLSLVHLVDGHPGRREVLARHFRGELPAGRAADALGKSAVSVAAFAHRAHIEFHPTDRCHLRCVGCTYLHDRVPPPPPDSFPACEVGRLLAVFQPRALTLVGGGEPALYESEGTDLADLICGLGAGEFGPPPALGLITNGLLWPRGNPRWHEHLRWIRISVDAATPESYRRYKGVDAFDTAVDSVFRCLQETSIPLVGVGYLYRPENIVEAASLVASIAGRAARSCPGALDRLNIQFRPWRNPVGEVPITERVLSNVQVEEAAQELSLAVEGYPFLTSFVRKNTNLATNLLCGGARNEARGFDDCLFGLAKAVVRADGSVYPCSHKAARRDPAFCCGNVLHDSDAAIALKALYVAAASAREQCTRAPGTCLFCVFNNILEQDLAGSGDAGLWPEDDLFF